MKEREFQRSKKPGLMDYFVPLGKNPNADENILKEAVRLGLLVWIGHNLAERFLKHNPLLYRGDELTGEHRSVRIN